MSMRWLAALMLPVVLVAGCGREDAPAAVVSVAPVASAPEVAPDPAATGENLYAAHCMQCHEGQALRAPHRTIIGLMAPHRVVAALESGPMKEQGSKLSAAEHRLVAEYVTGMPFAEAAPLADALRCAADASPFDFGAPPDALGWGIDRGNRHFYSQAVAGLSREQVPALKLKWAFAFPDAIRARSQPVIGGGGLFVGSHDGTVYALDRNSGCVRWAFKASAEVRTGIVLDSWTAGDAAAKPAAYFGDLSGNVYAVDAQTGTLLWRDRPDDHPSLTITAAPVRFEDRLYVAMSALEVTAAADPAYPCCTFRGGVVAYDAASGKRLWTAHTIREVPAQVDVNARGTARIAPSGAPIWGSPSLDEKRRRLYVGTGENYSSPANDRSDAIIAFDLDDGSTVWSWQATAGDAWNMGCEAVDRTNCPPEDGPDYDFGAATVLTTTDDGRDILLAGQKSGTVHALNPDDGSVIWQRKLGRGGIQGGVHFGMSVEGGTLFAPISDYFGGPRWPGQPTPGLYALDIATGELRWSQPAADVCAGREFCSPGISAAISGIPGVVFAGGMDGWLRAHDSASGALVWEFDTAREFQAAGGIPARGGSLGGGAAPVFKDGMMYLMSGYGIYGHMPGNVLLAFGTE